MTPSNIIGLTGKAGAGKSLAAGFIQEYFEQKKAQRWDAKNYADALKGIAHILTGLSPEHFQDRDLKENFQMEPRWNLYSMFDKNGPLVDEQGQLLQMWGLDKARQTLDAINHYVHGQLSEGFVQMATEVCTPRKFMQMLGTNVMRTHTYENVWIDTLWAHFKPESKWVIGDVRFPNEAQAIRDRNGLVIRIDRPGLLTGNHVSETQMDTYSFDAVIDNSGSISELQSKLWTVLDQHYS